MSSMNPDSGRDAHIVTDTAAGGGLSGVAIRRPVFTAMMMLGLIVLGLFTRPVAFLLSGEMAVAYFQAHFPRSFWPILNGGEPPVLFCFIFLCH